MEERLAKGLLLLSRFPWLKLYNQAVSFSLTRCTSWAQSGESGWHRSELPQAGEGKSRLISQVRRDGDSPVIALVGFVKWTP